MTPARQELIRLALEMPEQAVATMANTIVWICPGLADLSKPMLGQAQLSIIRNLSVIGRDPALRAQLRSALALLEAGHFSTPPQPQPANVVELFPQVKP